MIPSITDMRKEFKEGNEGKGGERRGMEVVTDDVGG